jgi:hypothetical protein
MPAGPGAMNEMIRRTGVSGGRWWILAVVTTRGLANSAEIQATVRRLLDWLRSNNIVKGGWREAYEQIFEERAQHPRGSVARIIAEAFVTSVSAASAISVKPVTQAVREAYGLRTRAKKLLRELNGVDKHFAKLNLRSKRPAFSELGNEVVTAIAAVAQQLEQNRGVVAPTTTAKWKSFVGTTATALLNASMPFDEVLGLFPQGGTRDQIKARWNRRISRRASLKAVPKPRQRKKS